MPDATATGRTRSSQLAAERGELAQPIVPGSPDLLAEVALAARREQARSIGDALLRTDPPGSAGRPRSDRRRVRASPEASARPCGASETSWRASSAGTSTGCSRELEAFAQEARAEGIAAGCRCDAREPAGVDCRRRRVSAPRHRLRACELTLELGAKPLLMGIVNASPDSFSDGGLHSTLDAQIALARRLLSDGADILDVGGESASTGRPPVEIDEEIDRVVPLVERLAGELGALVSVDTYKPDRAGRGGRGGRADHQRRQRPARSPAWPRSARRAELPWC